MVTKTKKQVDEVNQMLKEKLLDMKEQEEKFTATAAELTVPALGVHKDENGGFHLILIKYDLDKDAAVIDTKQDLQTRDYAVALYKAKQYLVIDILKGGKL